MNKFKSLLTVQLKNMLGLSQFKYDLKHNKKAARKPLLALVIIALLIPSYVMLFMLVDVIIEVLASMSQESAILALGAVVTCLMTFFFGLMYCFSSFFAAKDLDMLLVLPIKSGSIVASKLICCIVYEYLFVLPIMLPILIKYSIFVGAGVLFWVYTLLMLIAMPFIPLSLAAILEMLLMKLFGMKTDAEKVQSIFMYVFIALMLGFEFFVNKTTSAAGNDLSAFLASKTALLTEISGSYPPAEFFANSLYASGTLSGFLNMLAFVGISAAVFALAVFIGENVYIKAVTQKGSSTSGKVKAVKYDKTMLRRDSAKTSRVMSIFKTDFKILLRTPVFAMNTMLMIPMMPVIFAISFSAIGKEQLNIMRIMLTQDMALMGQLAVLAAIFFAGVATTTSTAFSRDGKSFWINQIIPVKPIEHLMGRGLTSLILNFLMLVFIVGPVGLLGRWNFVYIASLIIAGTAVSLPLIPVGLLIDAIRPKLDWDDPAKAVKQNFNSIFCWLAAIVLCIICGAVALLSSSLGLGIYAALAADTLIGLLLAYLFTRLFIKKAADALTSK